MNLKRFIGTLITILTFLGVIYQQQNTPPNQEIVLQFTDSHVTLIESQSTLNLVKNQLYHLGAHNIRVKEIDGGILKITYYSSTEASDIKKKLIKKSNFLKGYSQSNQKYPTERLPSKNHLVNYNFDVFLIQNTSYVKSNQLAISFLELNTDNQRILIPNTLIHLPQLCDKNKSINQKTHKPCHDVLLSESKRFYNTLKVRAGPFV